MLGFYIKTYDKIFKKLIEINMKKSSDKILVKYYIKDVELCRNYKKHVRINLIKIQKIQNLLKYIEKKLIIFYNIDKSELFHLLK